MTALVPENGATTKTTGGSTISVPFTTSSADCVAVIFIYNAWNPTGITSVTDAEGNTWTRRGHGVSTDTSISVDIWWAHIPTSGSKTATIHASGSISQAVDVSVIAIPGVPDPDSPWDTNASLPAFHTNTDTATSTLPSETISTDATNSLVLGFYGARNTTAITQNSGWSALPTLTDNSNPGSHYIAGTYQNFSSQQSSLVVQTGENHNSYLFIVDAINGDSSGHPPSTNPITVTQSGFTDVEGTVDNIVDGDTNSGWKFGPYSDNTGKTITFDMGGWFYAQDFAQLGVAMSGLIGLGAGGFAMQMSADGTNWYNMPDSTSSIWLGNSTDYTFTPYPSSPLTTFSYIRLIGTGGQSMSDPSSGGSMLYRNVGFLQADDSPITIYGDTAPNPPTGDPDTDGGIPATPPDVAINVTGAGVEVLAVATPNIHVTGAAVEVLADTSPNINVTGIAVEVLSPVTPTGLHVTEARDTMNFRGYVGAFGVVGDLEAQETKDVFAGTGYQPVTGRLQTTEPKDTFSGYGRIPLTGILAVTERPDVFAGTGEGRGVNGVLETTEPPDVFAGEGSVPITSTLATTEVPDRVRFKGAGVTNSGNRRRQFFVT